MEGLQTVSYCCPCCGEENEAVVDCSAGPQQIYTEDCAVCCRPIVLNVAVSEAEGISVIAESES